MNRIIKYRAWTGKIMQFSDNLGTQEFQDWHEMVSFSAINGDDSVLRPIMQYTGLKDKNGKEIYEGDILKFDKQEWYRSPIKSYEDIEREPEHYSEVKWFRDGWSYDGSHSDLDTYCEIIGNIYENPELLK